MPKQNIADWWNYIDGFLAVFEARKMNEVAPSYKFHEYCISHTPFERLQKDEDNIIRLRLQPNVERQVTGSDVFQLCADPNLRMIYNAGIEENKSYGLAEFIFYEYSENIIKKYSTLSEGDIQAEISSFRSEIDSREKFLNTLEGQFSTTNKERLFEGSLSREQYDSRAFKRKVKEIDFEENLRKNKEAYIGNQLERLAIVSPIGIAIVDESGLYRGLFLYREMPQRKMYYLGDFKLVRRCLELTPYDTATIFHKFFLMSFGGGFDVAQERPANFTDREWAYWVYAQYYKA